MVKDRKSTASTSYVYHLLGDLVTYYLWSLISHMFFLLSNLTVATIPQQENEAKGRTDGESDHYQPGKAVALSLGS